MSERNFITDAAFVVFIQAIREMRERQKAYFKTRDRAVMLECLELEKNVDKLIAGVTWPSKNQPPNEPNA